MAQSILTKEGVKQEGLSSPKVEKEIFNPIKVQLLAMDLVTVESLTTTWKTVALFWRLTQKGKDYLLKTRSVKKAEAEAEAKEKDALVEALLDVKAEH